MFDPSVTNLPPLVIYSVHWAALITFILFRLILLDFLGGGPITHKLSHFSFPTESSIIFTFLSDFTMVSKGRAPGQLSCWPPEEYLCITPVHVWAIFTKASLFLFPIDYFCLFCCWILDIEDSFLFCVIFQVVFHFCPLCQLCFLQHLLSGISCNELISSYILRKVYRQATHLLSCLLTSS